MADITNKLNRKFVKIANKLTPAYEREFGMPCDVYLPIFNSYKSTTKYRDVKVFGPHQSPTYPKEPTYSRVLFYIPYLIKNEAMNSGELEYDQFYTEEDRERPFIETTKKRELPLQTKVVVYQGSSQIKFFVDRKTVVTGADGFMILRMYLSPLIKDNDDEELEQDEFIVDRVEEIDNCGYTMNIPDDEDY